MSGAVSHKRDEKLRFRLRAATHDQHRATEDMFALERRIATRASYRDLLVALYGFHAGIERRFRGLGLESALDPEQRLAKAAWIAQDLLALGLQDSDIARIPLCDMLPDIASPAEALGALYVTEGATLGGQVILKEIKARLGLTPDRGARYFASYGMRIGVMWQGFLTVLETEGRDPEAARAMEGAARATFVAFGAWLPPLPKLPMIGSVA